MTANDDLEPALDIVLGGFRLRVLGCLLPESYNDCARLNAEAECVCERRARGRPGHFFTVHDLAALTASLEAAHALKQRQGSAETLEHNLELSWEVGARGDIRVKISITPDQLNQTHDFFFDLDLSYLDAALAQCRAVLARYPVRFADTGVKLAKSGPLAIAVQAFGLDAAKPHRRASAATALTSGAVGRHEVPCRSDRGWLYDADRVR